jgi:hypothetical protein
MTTSVLARDGAPSIATSTLHELGLRDILLISDADGLAVRGMSTIAIWGRSVTLRNGSSLSNFYRDNNYAYGHNLAITYCGPFGRFVIAGGSATAAAGR